MTARTSIFVTLGFAGLVGLTAVASDGPGSDPGKAKDPGEPAPGPTSLLRPREVWGDFNADGRADLYLVNPAGADRLFQSQGDGRFADVTDSAGLAEINSSMFAAFEDFDADGDLDLWIASRDEHHLLMRNQGDGTFSVATYDARLEDIGQIRESDWVDYDEDGRADLRVLTLDGQLRFYHNSDDGTFEKVELTLPADTDAARFNLPSTSWADYDSDGILDLFVVSADGPSRLYHGLADGSFEDQTLAAGVELSATLKESAWSDYDGDRRPDLLLRTRNDQSLVFHNLGDGTFNRVDLSNGDSNSNGAIGVVRLDSDGNAIGDTPAITGLPDSANGVIRTPAGGAAAGGAAGNPDRGGSSRGTGVGGGGPGGPAGPVNPQAGCAASLQDQSAGGLGVCIEASRDPELGLLYPISQRFFIGPAGRIGINTLSPDASVDIQKPGPSGRAFRVMDDFYVDADNDFVGVNRNNQVASESFLVNTEEKVSGGMTVNTADGSANGFYSYSTKGSVQAMTYFNPNTGDWNVNNGGDHITVQKDGDVGIGTTTPTAGLHVTEVGSSGLSANITDRFFVNPGAGFVGVGRSTQLTGNELFGMSSDPKDVGYSGMYIDSKDTTTGKPFYGYAIDGRGQCWTEYQGDTGHWGLYHGGIKIKTTTAGDVGVGFVGTSTPLKNLHVTGTSTVADVMITPSITSSGSDSELWMMEDHDGTFGMLWRYDGGLNQMQLMSTTDGGATLSTPHIAVSRSTTATRVGIGRTASYELDVEGTTRTKKVIITGGADLVEGFQTGDETQIEPGTVMVIDPDNAGELMTSAESYDRKVAGVVSGAGGLEPGLRMGQNGIADGDTLVAMTGRVYVKCSAENGAIQPGDLLTTASLTGHAMKATDQTLCNGAVLGKAMTSLDQATGLVLVLVNLQ